MVGCIVPRHGSKKRTDRRSPSDSPRERAQPHRRVSGKAIDEQALELREGGASYSAIARRLELRRAGDAHGAFLRALKTRSLDDRQQLIVSEQERLDKLELRIRERDAALPEKLERRLGALESLRTSLQ
jgi:hypothetical protein